VHTWQSVTFAFLNISLLKMHCLDWHFCGQLV